MNPAGPCMRHAAEPFTHNYAGVEDANITLPVFTYLVNN
jgi:hypothetical protein